MPKSLNLLNSDVNLLINSSFLNFWDLVFNISFIKFLAVLTFLKPVACNSALERFFKINHCYIIILDKNLFFKWFFKYLFIKINI